MRLCYTLIFVFFIYSCFAQPDLSVRSKHINSATLLTKTVASARDDHDTSQVLYVSNQAGDSLVVYTVTGGVVEPSIVYYKAIRPGVVCLISGPSDSLTVGFDDTMKKVLVGNDTYHLYQPYYNQFKKAVLVNHSVMAILGLLEDRIGDYAIENILPLFQFTPHVFNKRIQKATVVTLRSQADDVNDIWHCAYRYDERGKLKSVTAASGKEIRFSKKVLFGIMGISAIKIYRNIEERQITDRTITYVKNNRSVIKWQELILETGKNRQTSLTTTFKKTKLYPVKNIIMSTAEVLKFIDQPLSSK